MRSHLFIIAIPTATVAICDVPFFNRSPDGSFLLQSLSSTQEFNAITGLNGSGKSNILDSICFVLGITNLANVRAANLTELVYKSGQVRFRAFGAERRLRGACLLLFFYDSSCAGCTYMI